MGFRDCMMRCGSQQPSQLNLRVDEHGLGRFPAIHPELLELPAAATEEYRILGFRRASAGNETSETWSGRQAGRLGCSQRWAENSHPDPDPDPGHAGQHTATAAAAEAEARNPSSPPLLSLPTRLATLNPSNPLLRWGQDP
jgi:hypothetical protein